MLRCLFLVLALPLTLLLAKEDFPSPEQSAQRMKLPEGFRVQLVAGEPTLIKPIAMATDEKGRLWVVESHCYPHWIKEKGPGKDRVLILEPTNEGSFSCKVFLDNGVNLSGIALGMGGVWLASVPTIQFIPLQDDKPAGPPTVHLEGFSLKTKHNVVNSLCWGPDGWLYGLNGIESKSSIGAPGTPQSKRVPMDCGVWRYHPQRKIVEAVAYGTTNPWGLDWDEHGEMFITNCVLKHLFHVVPGAHFVRMYGQDVNPHSYELLESCADHLHWGGGSWTTSRGGKGDHSAAGGGHAHAGALFYLGDNWPRLYRNRIFMANIHGNRINQDRLERQGSGYVARHCEDFLFAHDSWFRGLALTLGADGGVFISDWHDTGECHNYDKTHPSGRIYRVTFGSPKPVLTDLAKMSDQDLVQLQKHENDWWVRTARRILQERAVQGILSDKVAPALRHMLHEEKSLAKRLRALWALYVIGQADESRLLSLLDDPAEQMRIWAIRLLVDSGQVPKRIAEKLTDRARREKTSSVRLALASALQKFDLVDRWELATQLCTHAEDARDAYLPLMIWYGVEPAVVSYPVRAAELLSKARIPLIRRHLARRLASLAE